MIPDYDPTAFSVGGAAPVGGWVMWSRERNRQPGEGVGHVVGGRGTPLRLRADDTHSREDQLARMTAVQASLDILRAAEAQGTRPEVSAALRHVVAEYEQRLSELGTAGETRDNARERRAAEKRFRCDALQAERAAIDRLWRGNLISDEVHRPLQQLLDHEEALLVGRTTRVEANG